MWHKATEQELYHLKEGTMIRVNGDKALFFDVTTDPDENVCVMYTKSAYTDRVYEATNTEVEVWK